MKTVFITGGSTGIGAASVKKFIAQGWNVGFMDINKEAAVLLMDELKCPERLIFVEGNTRVRADIHRAVEATVAAFGKRCRSDSASDIPRNTPAPPMRRNFDRSEPRPGRGRNAKHIPQPSCGSFNYRGLRRSRAWGGTGNSPFLPSNAP